VTARAGILDQEICVSLKKTFRQISSCLDTQPGWSWVFIVPVILLSWIKFPAGAGHGSKLFSPSKRSQQTGTGLCIATYNIHRAKGTDHFRNLQRITEALSGLDLVALQEVSGPQVWGSENQACQLAQRLGLGWLFAPTRYRAFKPDVGNALLSNQPMVDWEYHPLPTSSGSMRNLVSATLKFDHTAVTILATHIDRGIDRSRQLAFVLEKFLEYPHAMVLGDLNTRAQQAPLQEFLQANPGSDAIRLGGVANQVQRIDWILTRGLVVGRGGYRPVGPSDHPLYWIQILGLADVEGDSGTVC